LRLKWPGLGTLNTLVISVDRHEFGIGTEPAQYAGKLFLPKQEAHITVLGSTPGSRLSQQFDHDSASERKVRQAFEGIDWCYEKTSDLRHLVRQETNDGDVEESIIMLVRMDGMTLFYKRLKALGLMPADQPVPPAHVTLYTHNCDPGIGVHSDAELAELTRGRIEHLA
jgi:hypothetical protein